MFMETSMEETKDSDKWQPDDGFMSFCQILYKCKLCTTESVVFTSNEAFISHVKEFHVKEIRDSKFAK